MTNFAWVKNIFWFREDIANNLLEAELILMDGHPKSACNALKACVENILTDFCGKRGIKKVPNYGLYDTLQIPALRRELKDEKLLAGLEEVRICGNKGSHSMEDVDFARADKCFETVASLIYRVVAIVGDPRLPRWNFYHYAVDRREKTVEVVKTVEVEKTVEKIVEVKVEDTTRIDQLTKERDAAEWTLKTQEEESRKQADRHAKALEDEKRKTAKATKIAADSKLEVASAKEREVLAVARADKAEAEVERLTKNNEMTEAADFMFEQLLGL